MKIDEYGMNILYGYVTEGGGVVYYITYNGWLAADVYENGKEYILRSACHPFMPKEKTFAAFPTKEQITNFLTDCRVKT